MIRFFGRYGITVTLFLIVAWSISCSGTNGSRPEKSNGEEVATPSIAEPARLFRMSRPSENEELILSKGFRVELTAEKQGETPDSVRIWFDGKYVATLGKDQMNLDILPAFVSRTGRNALKAVAYRGKDESQTVTRQLVVYSDIAPVRKGYKVVNTFPHDKGAYTQGLLFHEGYLYEGTGQENESNLRKVDIKSGQVISQHNLDPELFGEGIAMIGEKIYQLTWRSKVGFIYDRNSFTQLGKFYYQTEGWGLTTIGNRLVMSDGSNVLYFVNPDMFTVESRIEVYDNARKVDNLNELEYINGEIWANIYTTDLIACIDPATGKVNSVINLSGILKNREALKVDVLNGIAHDPATGRIFVTGKYWPSLFEIKVTQ